MKKIIFYIFFIALLSIKLTHCDVYSYKVIESIKHDANYFIEGLTFTDESFIVESVGLTGKSKLVLYDNEGTEKTAKSNHRNEFAEGTTFFTPQSGLFYPKMAKKREFIAQLTYKKKVIYFYALHKVEEEYEIESVGKAKLPSDIKEGWGLSSSVSGKQLLMTDGSSSVYFLSLKSSTSSDEFNIEVKIAHTVSVHDCDSKFTYLRGLNELELIPSSLFETAEENELSHLDGIFEEEMSIAKHYLLTNVIGTWCVAIIDLEFNGKVIGWLNLKDIDQDFTKYDKVANGIAYRFSDESIWVSGKRWSKTYRIELVKDESSFNAKKVCQTPWSTQSSKYRIDNCKNEL